MSDVVGLVIIGAGPAGMSAAIAAREHGTDVLVLDEQAAPGGQIYRNVETVTAERPGSWDPDNGDKGGNAWKGPILMQGISRSGMMHSAAGHGPFEVENC